MVIRYVRMGKPRSCQNFHRRINVEVVMLALNYKVLETLHNGTRSMVDVNGILNTITARVRNPLSTSHKMPFHVLPERIAHTSMAASKTHSGSYSFTHISPLLTGDLPHCPARNKEIIGGKVFEVL